jgi:hypothetical protein
MARDRLIQSQQKSVINAVVTPARGLGLPPPGALPDTIGRRTGQSRRTPIGHGLEGETSWLVAQHGRRSDSVRNIDVNPRVERQQVLSHGDFWRRLYVGASGAMGGDPVTVRIDPLDSAFT